MVIVTIMIMEVIIIVTIVTIIVIKDHDSLRDHENPASNLLEGILELSVDCPMPI